MNKKFVFTVMVGLSVILTQSAAFSKQASNTGKQLIIVGFIGKAEIKTGKNKWKVLNIEDKVSENSEVRVLKKDDYLELSSDDTVYKITGGSLIKIEDLLKKQDSNKMRTVNNDDVFKVETSAEVAGVRGGVTKNKSAAAQAVILPAELSFAVTGIYQGVCQFRTGDTNNTNWQAIEYGIRLHSEAEILIPGTNSSIQLRFFDRSSTNLTGPIQVKLYDILLEKLNSL